ncbi:hypothetical protein HNY73_002945 [Argiope bruennichi]|uniref:Uncharacterized protein n=1 Tax=Argiope bruennichi TaxID=94029 RepID=A0A8T0FVB3_ARGBR|nr:hypothetical protein HNY73_002945 [Argiope bruennichi]
MSIKGKTIHSTERNIINNVTKFCKDEARAETLLFPLFQAQKRAASGTDVSLRTSTRIKKKDISTNGQLSRSGKHLKRPEARNTIMENFDMCVLRNIVNEFYANNKIPSLSQLRSVVKARKIFYGKEELSWRFRFLREMKKFREAKRNFVYIDETWLDSNLSSEKCWRDEKIGAAIKDSSGHHLIVVHAGSESGFVPNAGLIFKAGSAIGDYHGQMN